jgi:hypothetical protein
MAIGLSLTPRGYNVDTTGKSYTLDPDPLMRAQEKNFALQRESQKGVMDVAKKGFDFIEYLGARQQLGRVKAQLGELNPNDPAFAQRYSDIILGNPLAFEHAATGPLAKMALAPVTAMAVGAIEQKYKLEQIAETGRQQLAVAGVKSSSSETNALIRALYGGSGGGAGRAPKGWESLEGGGGGGATNTPENDVLSPASIYSSVGTGVNNRATQTGAGTGGPGAELYPLPTDTPPPFTPDGLLPGTREGEPTPRFAPEESDATQTPTTGRYVPRAPFAPAALAPIGQEPGPDFSNITAPPQDRSLVAAVPADATDSPVAPEAVPAADRMKVIVDPTTGQRWIPTEIGADKKYEPFNPAEKPPQNPGPGRQWVVTETYANGASKKWENLPEIKTTSEERAQFNERRDVVLNADTDLLKLKAASTALADHLASLELEYKPYATDTKDKDNSGKRKELGPELNKVRAAASKAKIEYEHAKAIKTLKFAAREDPKMYEIMQRGLTEKAAEDTREELDKWAAPLLRQHLGMRPEGEEDVTASPEEGKPVAEPSKPASEVLLARNPYVQERNKNWNEEKTFVVEEAKSIATKLGLPEDALIRAVREKDRDSISAILSEAQEKGITSPILEMRPSRGTGFGGDIMPTTPTGKELGWKRSKKVRDNLGMGHSYLDVLGFAAAEMGATAGTLPKWKFGEKLSKTKP